jgi:hypothetical protein
MTAKTRAIPVLHRDYSRLKYHDTARLLRQVTQPPFIAGPLVASDVTLDKIINSMKLLSKRSIFLLLSLLIYVGFNELDAQKIMNDYSFLHKYQFKKIPLKESTSFDNFEYKEKLSKDQMILLKLDKICSPNSVDFITATVNYRLKLSEKYNTVVITYSQSELILITVLANYDLEYNLIDFKQIAYDENFDNWSRSVSEIHANFLNVTYIDLSSGKSIKKVRTYSIDDNGKINASH